MKKDDILQSNTISLEEFIINVFTEEDRKYEAYKDKANIEDNNKNFKLIISIILLISTLGFLGFEEAKELMPNGVDTIITFSLGGFFTILFTVLIMDSKPNSYNKMKKVASVHNHEDIMKLNNSNPHMLLLLKYILNTDKYNTINMKTISDILLKNNIKHMVQEVDDYFTLTIYLNDTTYIIESSSLLCSNILKMPDNLILDVLELCNLDESFINYSWDDIVKHIENMNQRDDKRAAMNKINKLNNIDISKIKEINIKNDKTLKNNTNTINLEEFIVNIFTEEDRKYESYKVGKVFKNDNKDSFTYVIGLILFSIIIIDYTLSVFIILSTSLSIITLWDLYSTDKMRKLDSIYNHKDIMKLKNHNPHILLLLKYILNADKYSGMNIKNISDILLKNNIKHILQEVDNNLILTIYFNDTTYFIKSDSLSNDTLIMSDNLILDVLKLCSLDESFINYNWDEIVEYIEKMNQRDDERAVMNEINKINNIDISK